MADDTSFFRREAIEASRNRTGGPVNNQGLASWILVVFMITAFVSAIVFLSLARYGKKETVSGQILPANGVVRVTSPRPGIVTTLGVASDKLVKAGDPLFLLTYDAVLEDGSRFAAETGQLTLQQIQYSDEEAMARARRLRENQHATQSKIDSLQAALPLLEEQRLLQAERVGILQKSFDSMSGLADKQYVSQAQLATRKEALIQARQTLLQMDQSIAQQTHQIRQLNAELAGGEYDLATIQSSRKNTRAQLEERRLNTLSAQGGRINALTTGRLTNVQVKPGDFVQANQTLALIVPENETSFPQVVLWVPSRAIGFIEKNDKVRLMFDAFPYQTFGVGRGRVAEISMAPILPTELPIPLDTKEQMYKVIVNLDSRTHEAYGRSWTLRAGMRLTADLVIDEKSLLDWLLDPVTAIRKRAEH